MGLKSAHEEKPRRLYLKTYLRFIQNSIGTGMFRNFYIQTPDVTEMDATSEGSKSCAFYVSSILTIFGKISGIHGMVKSTVEDLARSGWQKVEDSDMQAGDVIVWEAMELGGELNEHIGFYIGDNRAVSTSSTEKKVVEHDAHYGDTRAIEQVFRFTKWDKQAVIKNN